MIDTELIFILMGVAFVAGFVDSIAGGGGLLALPSLLLAGLDPVSALATSKLQGTFGTASATHTFWKKGLLKPRDHILEIVTVFIGSALGVLCVSIVPTELLEQAIPPVLIVIAIYFALSNRVSVHASKSLLPLAAFSFAIGPMIGFYDGVFGPGTGSFFMLALTSLFGFGLIEATARTKLLNLTSNGSALLFFALGGHMVWTVGLAMGLAQIAGAQIGARVAIANGAKVIRPLLVLMCIAMAIRLYMKA
jgi:uncharacterized protein